MRLLLAIALLLATSQAQQNPVGAPVDYDSPFKNQNLKIPPLTPKIHIHTVILRCKGAPDGVYGRSDGVYYACLDGKEVCSREKRKIPKEMIAAYDAERAAFDARHKEFHDKLVREGRSTGDPEADRKAARARHQALVESKESGRAAKNQSKLIEIPATAGTPADATAPAAPAPATLSEEQVKDIAFGTPADDVLRQFGEPSFKISGPTGQFIYPLTSGKEAWLEFKDGKLARLRIAAR
jgi:hypothetical protein